MKIFSLIVNTLREKKIANFKTILYIFLGSTFIKQASFIN